MKNIATALLKAQTEMSNPKKDATNPFFKSKYADLNAVREAVIQILNNNGIVVLQPLVNIENKNFVKTILIHESGEVFESLAEIFCKNTNDPQAYGSGVSYARRYSLSSICCIGADDDDGNKASAPNDPNIAKLKACKSLDELSKVFKSIANPSKEITSLTVELKSKLS